MVKILQPTEPFYRQLWPSKARENHLPFLTSCKVRPRYFIMTSCVISALILISFLSSSKENGAQSTTLKQVVRNDIINQSSNNREAKIELINDHLLYKGKYPQHGDHVRDTESLPLRLCRVTTAGVKAPITSINEPIGVPYQCAGPSYEYFSKKLISFISKASKYGKDPEHWGRRSLPMPPNSSILFFGNSHTRQVFQSFMCQYQNEIMNVTRLLGADSKGSGIWDVRLPKNVTVFGVFNVPHVYSERWMELLTLSMNRSVDSVQVIVLGKFNTFNDSVNTTFAQLMKNMTTGTDADFERIRPPDLNAIAQVYSGPIVSVSMFSAADIERYQTTLNDTADLREGGRTNIHPINGREYVQYIGECATDKSDSVGTCSKDFGSTKSRGKNGHRCVGSSGGHPDLIAWDIIEACYRLLGS